ncbi:MAG: hypothetical protein LRY35_03700 [Clostridiales bacterium]|nr:hypothetical protein [Clostridiales bacterium]
MVLDTQPIDETQFANALAAENLEDFISEPDDVFTLDPLDAPAALEALLFMAGDPIPVEKTGTVTGLEKKRFDPGPGQNG